MVSGAENHYQPESTENEIINHPLEIQLSLYVVELKLEVLSNNSDFYVLKLYCSC